MYYQYYIYDTKSSWSNWYNEKEDHTWHTIEWTQSQYQENIVVSAVTHLHLWWKHDAVINGFVVTPSFYPFVVGDAVNFNMSITAYATSIIMKVTQVHGRTVMNAVSFLVKKNSKCFPEILWTLLAFKHDASIAEAKAPSIGGPNLE